MKLSCSTLYISNPVAIRHGPLGMQKQQSKEIVDVKVPDIGDYDAAEIIEVFVKVGDDIAEEDSLITLETDKASMEVPSSASGKITEIAVKVGDKVSIRESRPFSKNKKFEVIGENK